MSSRTLSVVACRFLSVFCVWMTLGGAALAAEGVIEINQAAALAGGVTPGDTPGFPVTLSRRGSYRLTGNLDSPLGTGAIVITATMVTLDLGGFTIASTNSCTGYPTTSCTNENGTPGISAGAAAFLATVRNGVVTGMGGDCLELAGPSSEVEYIRAFACGRDGINVNLGGASRVSHNFAGLNRRLGILALDGSTIEDNEVRANGTGGILGNGTRLPIFVSRNRVLDNSGIGVEGQFGDITLVTGNMFSGNTLTHYARARSSLDNLCHNFFC